MSNKAHAIIKSLIETLVEDGQGQLDVVTDAYDFLRSEAPVFQPTERGELISQLRHALYLAESPNEDVVEFEIGDTDFSFDYS